MKIAIPLNSEIISKINDANKFAIVSIENSSIENIIYVKNIDNIFGKTDYLIVNNSNEEVSEMYNYSIQVLKTPSPDMSINQLVEDCIFRGLFEL